MPSYRRELIQKLMLLLCSVSDGARAESAISPITFSADVCAFLALCEGAPAQPLILKKSIGNEIFVCYHTQLLMHGVN